MRIHSALLILVFILITACGPSPEAQVSMTATAQTATAAVWTKTSTPTATFTSTNTFTPTLTPTSTPTLTPTITATPTITPTPTFDFPKVTVNKALAACKFGPAKAYLWKFDLKLGDKGIVWGRSPYSDWLYVKMDRLNDGCWLSPYVVDVEGDVNTVIVEQVRLWITNALYGPPQDVRAVRDGDQVTVTWDQVAMTQDDDRGYFLDVWVCQAGNYVWMPTGILDQYRTYVTFTDGPGCSTPSGGKIYTVEKHGYTSPVDIPWPPK
jgi:hypothetical protein